MRRTFGFIGGFLLGLLCMTFLGWKILQTPTLQSLIGAQVGLDVTQRMDAIEANLAAIGVSGDIADMQAKYLLIDDLLAGGYYDTLEIDRQAMKENAIKGYVDALGDPYTTYLTIDENALFDEEMHGSRDFEGIGAVVIKKEDGVMIEEVLKGYPAYLAGLRPLDLILEIDGESVQGLSLSESVSKIRGPKGTDVILTIYREAENTLQEIPVMRDAVNVPSVKGELLEIAGKKILYIEIAIIGEDTMISLHDVITTYRAQADGVLLDLRGNGGGYLPVAVDIVSFFLPTNELVTTAKYGLLQDEVYRSKGYGDLLGKPLIVLIDGLSASASEIIAGALQQRGDAVLLGTKTFGKGSIQTIASIDDGSSLKYTIGKWYLPDDTNVDKIGLTPDVVVEFDVDGYLSGEVDNQLEQAKERIVTLMQE